MTVDKGTGKKSENEARQVFQDAAGNLDQETLDRLGEARRVALKEVADTRPTLVPARWIPVAAAAGLGVVAVWTLWPSTNPGPELLSADLAGEDMEILLAGESLDFLSDLDFYLWLDLEPDSG